MWQLNETMLKKSQYDFEMKDNLCEVLRTEIQVGAEFIQIRAALLQTIPPYKPEIRQPVGCAEKYQTLFTFKR